MISLSEIEVARRYDFDGVVVQVNRVIEFSEGDMKKTTTYYIDLVQYTAAQLAALYDIIDELRKKGELK